MTKRDEEWIDVRRSYYYLDISGRRFSPQQAEKKTSLLLVEKLEPGDPCDFLGKRHPHRGRPAATGCAILEAPVHVEDGHVQAWIIRAVRRCAAMLRKLGATDIVFWEVHFLRHGAQENFEMTVDEMRTLAKERVPYCMSVYHAGKRELMAMSSRMHCRKWLSESRKPNTASQPIAAKRGSG